METETIDKLFLELSQVTTAKTEREISLQSENMTLQYKNGRLLKAVQFAYQKHTLLDDKIGWNELQDVMCDALCEAMGGKGFQNWLAGIRQE